MAGRGPDRCTDDGSLARGHHDVLDYTGTITTGVGVGVGSCPETEYAAGAAAAGWAAADGHVTEPLARHAARPTATTREPTQRGRRVHGRAMK